MGYRHYPQYTWIRRRSGFRRGFSWAEGRGGGAVAAIFTNFDKCNSILN